MLLLLPLEVIGLKMNQFKIPNMLFNTSPKILLIQKCITYICDMSVCQANKTSQQWEVHEGGPTMALHDKQ